MQRTIMRAGLALLTACAAFPQTFEVASIKPAAPMTAGRIMVRMAGGPGTPDPGQITYTNVTLKNVMTTAYNVKGYQISGPAWFESERFDITAKIAPNTSKEQFQVMLQNLLAERFKLTLHHQTKDLPMYALTVAKGGPKMKESEDDPNAAAPGGPNAGGGAGGGAFVRPTIGKDGMPELPKGAAGRGMIMMGMNGRTRMAANGQTTSQLAETLSNQLARPVTDMTGLTKKYDYTLDFAPDEGQISMMKGMAMPPPGEGGGAGPAPSADGNNGPSLFSAVQDQLGLKLEARKGQVDMLIIDTLEKVPTEN